MVKPKRQTLTEPELIDRIRRWAGSFRDSSAGRSHGKRAPAIALGIGDDCAVLPWNKRERLLVTTDMLIEDRHFIRKQVAAADLGYKALAVNLSDLAAMGAQPLAAFLALSVPPETSVEELKAFVNKLRSSDPKEAAALQRFNGF